MDSNTHSTSGPDKLGALVAAVDGLTTQDLDGLTDAALADQLQVLRRQLDRQEGQWLRTWPRWTPAAPAAPTRTSRPPPPPAGCGPGCG